MRSDTYTIIFTSVVTIVLGLVISFTADSLRDRQEINEALDIKKIFYLSLVTIRLLVCGRMIKFNQFMRKI